MALASHRLHLPALQPDSGAHGAAKRRDAAAAREDEREGAATARDDGARAGRSRRPLSHYPRQLSGGQEQRVAIARAIVSDPKVVLADEPTGDLDRKSAEEVLSLLVRLNQEFGKTIVMVTHDPHAAERAKRILHLEKGDLS